MTCKPALPYNIRTVFWGITLTGSRSGIRICIEDFLNVFRGPILCFTFHCKLKKPILAPSFPRGVSAQQEVLSSRVLERFGQWPRLFH